MNQQPMDPFRGLVAQVTNTPFIPDSQEVPSGIKRTVHCLLSQGDEEEDIQADRRARAAKIKNQLQSRHQSALQGRAQLQHTGYAQMNSYQQVHTPTGADRAGGRPSREITPAEKSLISKMHTYVPAAQLLDILNERLRFDLGDTAIPYTLDQLKAEIDATAVTVDDGPSDWAGMRKLLNKARRAGVLDSVNEQVINDFAVVFSLNTKQVLSLKDVLLNSAED